MKLSGKVSLITGGGRGIGRAIAVRFADEGSAVVVAGTSTQKLEEVATEIRDRGGRAFAVRADVSDQAQTERMVASALDQFGQIDVLVNNAGIIGPTAPVPNIALDDWNEVLAVNLTGAFLCAKYTLPNMIKRGAGRIINITSVGGLIGYALRSPYAVSKWGMIGLTRTVALEVGKYGITVNAIAPGPIKGERMNEVIRRRASEMGRTFEEVEAEYLQPIALKRMAEETDVAAMALFLASDEGRNISGETLTVSGGFPI